MAKAFRDLEDNPESAALGHAEWLGILLERESPQRSRKLTRVCSFELTH
jgi:hypothetical protein